MAKTKKTENVTTVENTTTIVPATDVIDNGAMSLSKTDLAAAVGFDYEKQITLLTPKQKKQYLALADSIVESDITSIQAYGAEVSKSIEDNGNSLLESVRSNNSNNEANQLINDLLAELRMVDVDDLQQTSLKKLLRKIPGLRKLIMTADKIQIKYDNIRSNVDQIATKIKNHKVIAARDNNTLQIIFDNNCEYIKEIRELIIAAKLKNQEMLDKIEYMKEHPEQYSPINVHDAQTFQNELARRIADMQITEYVFNQNLFQIRAIQSNNQSLSNKAEAIVTTVIPIWKNQLALSVIMCNQQDSIETQKKITDTTNKILRKNAEMMKTNTINVAKANEEAVVSLDTLQATTKDLIDTITEVKKIQTDGAKMRATLEQNLVDYSNQLTEKINQLSIEQ